LYYRLGDNIASN